MGSPYPKVLYSGQDVIETTLIARLEKRGGRLESRRCRHLVAADGAKSTVRPLLGLDFEPVKLKRRMNRQVGAKLSWRRSGQPDQLWFFYYEHGFCGVLSVWGGYHRLFFLADDAGVPDRDPTLHEIQASRARSPATRR